LRKRWTWPIFFSLHIFFVFKLLAFKEAKSKILIICSFTIGFSQKQLSYSN